MLAIFFSDGLSCLDSLEDRGGASGGKTGGGSSVSGFLSRAKTLHRMRSRGKYRNSKNPCLEKNILSADYGACQATVDNDRDDKVIIPPTTVCCTDNKLIAPVGSSRANNGKSNRFGR